MVPEGLQYQRAVLLQTTLAELQARAEEAVSAGAVADWNRFVAEDNGSDQLRLGLYRAADALIKSEQVPPGLCPLCGQAMELHALANKVVGELGALEGAARALEEAQQRGKGFLSLLEDAHRARSELRSRAQKMGVQLAELPMIPSDEIAGQIMSVRAIGETSISRYQAELSGWDTDAIEGIRAQIPAVATVRDQALVELGVLVTETSNWRSVLFRHRDADAAFALADRVFTKYQQHQHQYFGGIVQRISGRTAEIYGFLHPEGGIAAVAVETVGQKGAELSVEFHGRRELPPHRVLSESHLNSLGIALFLAMAETFNDQLGFLVLDDVVNSFDREHRGRLAELLVKQFEDRQLIVLTHDEQFFARLSGLGPSWPAHHFTSWDYGNGPRTSRYEGDRLLQEAEQQLRAGDRIGAAQKGRRALEDLLQEACEKLEALLRFRRGYRNDQRMVEEVIQGLRRSMKERARDFYAALRDLLEAIEADLRAALNVAAHASQGATSAQEVSDALQRIGELRRRFSCGACGTMMWYRGTAEVCRCKCGQTTFPPPLPVT